MDCFDGKDCNKTDCPYKHPSNGEGAADKRGKKGDRRKRPECWTCGEVGHISRDCPLQPSNARRS